MRYCVGTLLDCNGKIRDFRYAVRGEPIDYIKIIEREHMPGSRVLTITLEPLETAMTVSEYREHRRIPETVDDGMEKR